MNNEPIYSVDEFEREARYLEAMIWDAMAIEPGMKVLFCGYGPDGEQVRHAVDSGVDTTVIEHRDHEMRRFANLGAKLVRGSTSVIPAKENTFDLAVAFHYLHEIDPFFHAQVLSELARVAHRVAVVEPSPPADALGKRIALLYSQAKRELGQFEYYQPLEYWKKLLQAVKADITQHVFAFAKIPPREYLADTIDLLLRTMEVEQAPDNYIAELRTLARRSDQLLPPPRYVLVGAAAGELVPPRFRNREEVEAAAKPSKSVTAAAAALAASAVATPAPATPAAASPPPSAVPPPARPVTAEEGYEFPPVEPPAPAPSAQPAPPPLPPAFSPVVKEPAVPPKPQEKTPFGAPFAMPTADAFGAPPAGIPASTTWAWEPPEGEDDDDEEAFKPH
ncbi:MAG: class I SAM-dependent methyltransferase [Candidatus Eremiobacteraeota bacterium]|nr:class I SAM-dependent methyltransferase [Candidatus Eremiobacteraeota bacterium]